MHIQYVSSTYLTAMLCHCRGKYDGPEPQRLAVLKYAALLGASHVDVELKVATYFFAGSAALIFDQAIAM